MANASQTIDDGKYTIFFDRNSKYLVCYKDTMPITGNYWQIKNPTVKYLPIFTVQVGLFILLIRVLMLIFKPLRQPRFLAEILAGIIFGPSLLGRVTWIAHHINPYEGAYLVDTMANLGVTFYMFLVGLEMDFTPIRRIGKTALIIAIASIVLPLCTGAGLHYLVWRAGGEKSPFIGIFFWAIALSVTSFPDLARTLSDLKLLYTDLGKTALTAAVVSHLSSWLLLVGTVSLVNGHQKLYVAIPVFACMTMLWFMIRPLIYWVVKQNEDIKESSTEGKYNDKHVYMVLATVLLCGYLTELCGAHSMFGAFMFGLMIPSGELGTMVMEKIEDFIVEILLPPTFLVTGMRTNFTSVFSKFNLGMVLLVAFSACSAKIVSALLACFYLKCPNRDSLALGILMNTKGVLVLIVLNEARSMKVFDQQTFSLIVLAIFTMTIIIGPVVGFTHKSARDVKHYYRRSLEKSRQEAELRVLACIHSTKNLSGLINLLRLTNATRKSPIAVFAVHLVELAGRATAMLIFHDKNNTDDVGNSATREKAEGEQIVNAFESLERDNHAATVQALTAVSPYATMHEDVNSFALDKLANIILIPFHRQPNALGGWVDENIQHKQVNLNLLANALCSLGLLVDRGLTSPIFSESQQNMRVCHVAVLFLEGPDDREALAYAWRMVGTPRLTITVVRFLPGKEASELMTESIGEDDESGIFTAMFEKEKDKQLDDEYVNDFRFKTMHDQSVAYIEKQVNGGDEIVSLINSSFNHFNLYIVGRGHGKTSPLTSGLSNWTDCPELGPLGETIVSTDSLSAASVLVVQQSSPLAAGSKKSRESSRSQGRFGNTANSAVETFVNHRRYDDDDEY